MDVSFFTPAYIEIVRKSGNRWQKLKTSAIVNLNDRIYDPIQQYSRFGLTFKGILIELYKRYQGLDGWYLVNMAEKEYFYCGAVASDVTEKLVELGICGGSDQK